MIYLLLSSILTVTEELNLLYWRIGKVISEKMRLEGWGAKTIDHLARDLENAFPGFADFSARNLRYMRTFSLTVFFKTRYLSRE